MGKCEWMNCNGQLDENNQCQLCKTENETRQLVEAKRIVSQMIASFGMELIAVDGVPMLQNENGHKMPIWSNKKVGATQ